VPVPSWHSLWCHHLGPKNLWPRCRHRNLLLQGASRTMLTPLLLRSVHQKCVEILDEAMLEGKMGWDSLFSSCNVDEKRHCSRATPRHWHRHSTMIRQKATLERSTQFWSFALTRYQICTKSASCAQCTKEHIWFSWIQYVIHVTLAKKVFYLTKWLCTVHNSEVVPKELTIPTPDDPPWWFKKGLEFPCHCLTKYQDTQ
jgi:hypothetical protein